jgi:hypothetical protein
MMKNNKLIPFVVLLLVLIACKLPSLSGNGATNGSTTGGTTTGGTQGTATGGSDPKADVTEASRKFIQLDSFTANMNGEGQTAINSKVEYQAPDRFRIKYLGGTGAGMEMVVIGKDMYMKTGDKWTKMPGSGNIPNLRDSFTEEGLKSLNDVKYEGDETVDGKQTSVYSYKNVTPVGSYPFSCKIWVRHDKGIPMKIFVEYSNNQALKNMTVNYDVDTPVQIDPPLTK